MKIAATIVYKTIFDYYKKSIVTRLLAVVLICDLRYKLELLAYLYAVEGGITSDSYRMVQAHFEYVFSKYNNRAVDLREYARIEAENLAIDVAEAEGILLIDKERGQEGWRINSFDRYAIYQRLANLAAIYIENEVSR